MGVVRTDKKPTLDQVIAEIIKWSKTPEGKTAINKACDRAEEASEQIRKDCTLSPEKLKMVINI